MATESRTLFPGIAIQAPPAWGIEPVPQEHRRLRAIDIAVLWGDLGVGFLVLAAGALLVTILELSLVEAVAAIVIGSVLGSALLGLAGYIAATAGVPTMVLTRAALGTRGSYLATLLNVVQLLGWTAFEIFIMAHVAASLTRSVVGLETYALWAVVFAAICTLMAIGGPIVVVRQWLEKFAVWVVLGTSAFLFVWLFANFDIPALLRQPGKGGPFWAGVDLVIAMPISWFPLVADYNRFARARGESFWGTFVAYAVANVVFYALGALLVLALTTSPAPVPFTEAIVAALGAVFLGWLALVIVLVDETDQAFANIYSTAVSIQNVASRVPQRALAVAVGFVGLVLALLLSMAEYEFFLLLIGAFFVPLLGVVAADFFVVQRGSYRVEELYRRGGRYWYAGGVNLAAVLVWLVGFVVYQWASPTPLPGWPEAFGSLFTGVGLPFPLLPWFGGSIPAFIVAFVLYAAFGRLARTPSTGAR